MNWAIDENVIAVANDAGRVDRGEPPLCPQAGDKCRLACVTFLAEVIQSGRVLLDDLDVVFGKYRKKASLAGQPGSGDAFLKALYQSSYDPNRTSRVHLPKGPGYGLPQGFVSSGFDPDDMVYVALALADQPSQVANAVDSDYNQYQAEIANLGVSVRELCAD